MKREPGSLLHFFAPSIHAPEEEIQAALAALSERERAVVELRFGLKDGQSIPLQEVGQSFGVTGERIRQIESRALGKLRRLARSRPSRATDRIGRLETALTSQA